MQYSTVCPFIGHGLFYSFHDGIAHITVFSVFMLCSTVPIRTPMDRSHLPELDSAYSSSFTRFPVCSSSLICTNKTEMFFATMMFLNPKDGDNTFIRNVGIYLQNYMI